MGVPDWIYQIPWDLVRKYADQYRLDPYVVAATIMTESSGNQQAIRYEAQYRWVPEHNTMRDYGDMLGMSLDTVRMGMMTSWGPMQVMGGVAFEHGFRGWFPSLCGPLGIDYGCKHLQSKAQRYGDDPAVLYASYNAGSPRYTKGKHFSNQDEVNHFMRHYRDLKRLD